MSSDPRNIRNIPDEVTQIARRISQHTGLSESDVLRLALCSGILVEATKVTPDRSGTFAGVPGAYLAKALRRHLSSAIDFLLEQGQHPYQGTLGTAAPAQISAAPAFVPESEPVYDTAMADELEGMGFGMGLSMGMEDPVGA